MNLEKALERKNKLQNELKAINKKIEEFQLNGFQMYSFLKVNTAKRKLPKLEEWCFFHLMKKQSQIKLKKASYSDLIDVTGIYRGADPSEYMVSEDGLVIPKCVLKY